MANKANNLGFEHFNNMFEKASGEDTFESLPDGKYEVTINTASALLSKTGKPMVSYDMIVIDGEFEGRHIFKNSVVSDESSVNYIKRDFLKLGLELAKFSDITSRISEVEGTNLYVTIKAKEDSTAVYFNKVIE